MGDQEGFVHPKPVVPKGMQPVAAKSPFSGPGKNIPLPARQDVPALREKALAAYAMSRGGSAGAGCVAIKWAWWQAMKRFKDKVVDVVPGPVESPSDTLAMLQGGSDFVVIGQDVASALVSAFGGSANLIYDRRPDGTSLLTNATDGQARFVSAYIFLEPDGPGRMWMLAADISLHKAIESAVGYKPSDIQDYHRRAVDYGVHTGKWWDMAAVHITFDDYIGKWIRVTR